MEFDFSKDFPTPRELLDVLITTPPTLDGPIVANNLSRRLVKAKVEAGEWCDYAKVLRRRAAYLREKRGSSATDIAFHIDAAAEHFEKKAATGPANDKGHLAVILPPKELDGVAAPDGTAPVLVLDPGNHPEVRRS